MIPGKALPQKCDSDIYFTHKRTKLRLVEPTINNEKYTFLAAFYVCGTGRVHLTRGALCAP